MAIREPNGLRFNGRWITSHPGRSLCWRCWGGSREATAGGRRAGKSVGAWGQHPPAQEVASVWGLTVGLLGCSCLCEPAGLVAQGLWLCVNLRGWLPRGYSCAKQCWARILTLALGRTVCELRHCPLPSPSRRGKCVISTTSLEK